MRFCIVSGPVERFGNAADRFEQKLNSFGFETGRDPYDGKYDAMVAVGGDGTLLDASSAAVELDIPICGINTGRIGFLAAFDERDIDTLDRDFYSRLYLSERDLLCACVNGRKPPPARKRPGGKSMPRRRWPPPSSRQRCTACCGR